MIKIHILILILTKKGKYMLIQNCQKCGTENTDLLSISLKEGNFVSMLSVCQRCYQYLMNEQINKESKLLNG